MALGVRRALSLAVAISVLTVAAFAEDAEVEDNELEEVYSWKALDYAWPTEGCREMATTNGDYIPKNNAMVGVKLWGNRAYVSVPRWLPGVPSTLNWIPSDVEGGKGPLSSPLNPYPSWEMQEVGNCTAIQYVQSMEIDPLGRMWVLDVGRRNFFTGNPDNSCPPKILLLDLNDGGKVLHTFIFPEGVVSYSSSFLNDLVIDVSQGGDGSQWYAYISDAGGQSGLGGAIVVYHLGTDRAWRLVDEASMSAGKGEALEAVVGGRKARVRANVDGIALASLAEGADKIFYCPLGSFNLYTLPTSTLRTPLSEPGNVSEAVVNLGRRISQGDGMAVDSKGALYFGLLSQDGFARWTREAREKPDALPSEAEVVAKDFDRLQWVDSFGFDNEKQTLWVVSNRLQNLQEDDVKLEEVNYRLLRVKINARSYMYLD